jgi:hypothetical protein
MQVSKRQRKNLLFDSKRGECCVGNSPIKVNKRVTRKSSIQEEEEEA